MQIVNLATVTVDTTAAGSEILSSALATTAMSNGMNCIVINPSVDIVLVDAGGASPNPNIPGAVVGTVANSPFVCPANIPTVVLHRGGAVRGISSGSATVKRGLGMVP